MTDKRTVGDVLTEANLATHIFKADDGINSISVHTKIEAAARATDVLGIEPDLAIETLQRWLRYGKKADELGPCRDGRDDFHRGWHACLDAIKGDD